eukprot:scaffold11051_cov165-Amphora_coffeaeformis.AAC.10
MKRPRRREIEIVSLLILGAVSAVCASSRAADPFAPSTSSRYSDGDFYFEDEDDDEQVDPRIDNYQTNEEEEWWMDPLAAFDDEEDDTALDPLANNDADFLDDGLDTDPSLKVEPDTFSNDDTLLDNYVYEKNDDNIADDEDDFLDDFYSPLDEPEDAYASPLAPSPLVSPSSETSATAEEEDYGSLDDWMDDSEEFRDDLAPPSSSTSNFAQADEFDPTAPLSEPVPEPSKAPLAPKKEKVQKDDTVYDPVTPLPAPSETKKPPFASFFGLGSNKSNKKTKKAPRRVTESFGSSNTDPTGPISSVSLPTAAIASSLAALLPRFTNLVSGNAAAVMVVAITVGKFMAHFADKSEDDKIKASLTTKPLPTKRKKKSKKRNVSQNEEFEDEEEEEEDDQEYDAAGQVIRRVKKPVETPKLENLVRPQPNPSKQGRGWLGSLVQNSSQSISQSLPQPNKRNQVEELRKRAEQAEIDKANMEREYEKTSWELQETQSELNALKASTRHLQAQITDNEEMLDRVVQAERRRARDELQRMKEAMVKVVEEEREAMRSEFLKQAGELQMLWRKEQQQKYQAEQPQSGRRPVPKRHYS